MDAHCEMILQDFRESVPDLQIIYDVAMKELRRFIDGKRMVVTALEGRVKTEPSLAGKLERKGHKYATLSDITDLVGCRVITLYNHEVDEIAQFVRNTFAMDWENSVDKRKMYADDQFGYMSLHYIVRIPKELYFDPNHPLVNELRFEIQMRTTLQHAWAAIFHDTGYKTDVEVPREYIRALNRLAGLLELADDEFSMVFHSIQNYREEAKKKIAENNFAALSLSADSLREYLASSPFDKVIEMVEARGIVEMQPIGFAAYLQYLPILRKIGVETIADLDNMIGSFGRIAACMINSWAEIVHDGEKVPVMQTQIMRNVCLASMEGKGLGIAMAVWLFDELDGQSPRNLRKAQRAFNEIADAKMEIEKEGR